MKANVPAFLCLIVLLHCCWVIYHRDSERLAESKYKVEITVYGPDGKVIPAIRPR
jgi:hypothetical protein